jgi:hypothetical protein
VNEQTDSEQEALGGRRVSNSPTCRHIFPSIAICIVYLDGWQGEMQNLEQSNDWISKVREWQLPCVCPCPGQHKLCIKEVKEF